MLSARHTVSPRRWAARDHVDLPFDGALGPWGNFFILSQIAAEVPSSNQLLNLSLQLTALLRVVPVLPVETTIPRLVHELPWVPHRVGGLEQPLLLYLEKYLRSGCSQGGGR